MRLSLDLGLGSIATLNKGVGYLPEATALFARMTVQPDATRKGRINTLIKALKTAGVWSKLDALYLMAAHDQQAARRNWIADIYNLTAVSSPTFTADRGYQGDGVAAYLDTGFNPALATAPKFIQNSGHISVWSRTQAANASGTFVDAGNNNSLLLIRTATDGITHRTNGAASITLTNANGLGHFVTERSDAANVSLYRNGGLLQTSALASAAPNSSIIRMLGRSSPDSFSQRQQAAGSIGAGLTAQNVADMHSALNTYLTAIGAA